MSDSLSIANISLITFKFFSAFLFGIIINMIFGSHDRPSLTLVHVIAILIILSAIDQFDTTSPFYTKLGFLTSQVIVLNDMVHHLG